LPFKLLVPFGGKGGGKSKSLVFEEIDARLLFIFDGTRNLRK